MKVTEERAISAKITRYFHFEPDDAPVIAWPHSTAGRKVLVERVAVTYGWDTDGRKWEFPQYHDVQIVGAALKKDGTPGQVRYADRPAYGWQNMFNEEYDWLRQLVAAGLPEHRIPALPEVVEVNAGRGA